MTDPTERDDTLIGVVRMEGLDYATLRAMVRYNGSTLALIRYLAGWDSGAVTDITSASDSVTTLQDLESSPGTLTEISDQGHDYFLQYDHEEKFYALWRRPFPPDEVTPLTAEMPSAPWVTKEAPPTPHQRQTIPPAAAALTVASAGIVTVAIRATFIAHQAMKLLTRKGRKHG